MRIESERSSRLWPGPGARIWRPEISPPSARAIVRRSGAVIVVPPPSHGARQRPRQLGLRARHWESAAARARSRPAGRRIGATAKAEWRHQPRTHPASSSAWWRRGIPRQRRRPGSTRSASENDGRRARARRRSRLGVAEDDGARSCRRSPPFDVDEPCELAERLSAVAAQPAVTAENYKRALTAALELDPRPWQRNDQRAIVCNDAA